MAVPSRGHLREIPRARPLRDEQDELQLQAPRFDLYRLHLFVAVAQSGSLTAAGDLLGLPQSIMSRHVARLEKDFGGMLFVRNGRGVALSELGARVLPGVRQMLQQAAELAQTVDEYQEEPRGDVRVGLPSSLRGFLTVPLYFKLKEHYPLVRLTLKEGSTRQIEHWLRSGEIDLGLTHRYGRHSDLPSDTLLSLDLYLVGPRGDRVTRSECVEFRRLAGLPLILPQSPSEFRSCLDQAARSHHVTLDVIMEAEFGQIHQDLAKLGAYCVSTWHMIAEHARTGELQASRIVDPVIKRDIALAHSPGKANGQTNRAVAQLIRKIMASDAVTSATAR